MGGLAVAECGGGRVVMVASSPDMHHVYAVIGDEKRTQFGGSGLLRMPSHVTIQPVGMTVWVTDSNRLRKYSLYGRLLAKVECGPGQAQVMRPAGICVDDGGSLVVADEGGQRVKRFTDSGTYVDTLVDLAADPARLRPLGVAVSGGRLAVLVVGPSTAEVRVYRYVDHVNGLRWHSEFYACTE